MSIPNSIDMELTNPFLNMLIFSQMLTDMRDERKERNLLSRENKQLIDYEIRTWCKSKKISKALVSVIASLWDKSTTGCIPSLDDLVSYFSQRTCIHGLSLEENQRKELMRHFLVEFGTYPNCSQIEIATEYYQFHKKFPSEEEFQATLNRRVEMMMDPVEFHSKDKKLIPTANLDKIQTFVMEEKEDYPSCSLCLEDVTSGQKYFKLTPCGHVFHGDPCLENHSVLTWLSQYRTCPTCRGNVEIVSDKKDGTKSD